MSFTRRDDSVNGSPLSPQFALHHDAWGRLVLTDGNGRQHVGVQPIRAFPISDPEHGISLCDAEGREILWIDQLSTLLAPVRRMIEEDLAQREFMPLVRRILSVSAPMEPSEWEVETDRGFTRFILNSEDDIRPLSAHRAIIIDTHGIRYLIPDLRSLDAASRRLLERFL